MKLNLALSGLSELSTTMNLDLEWTKISSGLRLIKVKRIANLESAYLKTTDDIKKTYYEWDNVSLRGR